MDWFINPLALLFFLFCLLIFVNFLIFTYSFFFCSLLHVHVHLFYSPSSISSSSSLLSPLLIAPSIHPLNHPSNPSTACQNIKSSSPILHESLSHTSSSSYKLSSFRSPESGNTPSLAEVTSLKSCIKPRKSRNRKNKKAVSFTDTKKAVSNLDTA